MTDGRMPASANLIRVEHAGMGIAWDVALGDLKAQLAQLRMCKAHLETAERRLATTIARMENGQTSPPPPDRDYPRGGRLIADDMPVWLAGDPRAWLAKRFGRAKPRAAE